MTTSNDENQQPNPRRRPTKVQLTGEKFLEDRYVDAATTGDPNAVESLNTPTGRTWGIGAAIGVGGVAMAFLLGMITPSPDQGESEIIATQSGGMYVAYAEETGQPKRLHPVMNLASARLIVGSAEKPSVVKDDVLGTFPRGQLMGIPSAPNDLSYRSSDEHAASWGVCDWYDSRANLSLTAADTLQTTVIAGDDVWEGGDTLSGVDAILVRSSDGGGLYLLYDSFKAPVDEDDAAAHAALGIGHSDIRDAVTVTPGLLNAIEPRPEIAAPRLDGHGLPSDKIEGRNVGDVMTASTASGGTVYYAVLRDGVQRINPLVAELLTSSGGSASAARTSFDNMPQADEIDMSAYPSNAPVLSRPDALCYSWSKEPGTSREETKIIYGDRLPITSEARDNTVPIPATPGRATAFVSEPGKGWYVRTTGNGPRADEQSQVSYISDTGVRYDVLAEEGDYGPAVSALGLTGEPMQIPDGIARLLVRGPDLDRRAALVEHVNVPVTVAEFEEIETTTTPTPTTTTPAPTTEPDEPDQDVDGGDADEQIIDDDEGDPFIAEFMEQEAQRESEEGQD